MRPTCSRFGKPCRERPAGKGHWRHLKRMSRPRGALRAPLDPEVKSNQAREQARMGDLLIREGDRENAVGHYQEALCLDPACVPALAAVAWHGLYPLTEHELSRMQRLLADPRVPPDDAARLHFGLAHVQECAGGVRARVPTLPAGQHAAPGSFSGRRQGL